MRVDGIAKVFSYSLSLVTAVAVSAAILSMVCPAHAADNGAYRITITVPGVLFPISAISMFKGDGTLKEIDYVPTLGGIRSEEGFGSWRRNADGGYAFSYKTELPNGQVRQVDGLTTLSASGDKLAGTAIVKWLSREGAVVKTTNVKLAGDKAQSGLVAKR